MTIMIRRLQKTYSELITLPTFEERFEYLATAQKIGDTTFGHNRYLDQLLYRSDKWRKEVRPKILMRDDCCDLAMKDHNHDIDGIAVIHHINPITVEDILNNDPIVFDPENLITTWEITHKAIHFSDISLLPSLLVERKKYDTCPWRK